MQISEGQRWRHFAAVPVLIRQLLRRSQALGLLAAGPALGRLGARTMNQSMPTPPSPERSTSAVTFYTVADESFFPGVVALVNSLRVCGHSERVVVGDVGLRPDQRARLEGVAEVVNIAGDLIENPLLYKPFAHMFDPQGIVVIIDSDMVVTRRLDDVLASAAAGQICLFTDETQEERFFPEWQELFALRCPLRRQPSLNSGFVAFNVAQWPDLLSRWWEACATIPSAGTRSCGGPWAGPHWDGDQDALNALLMSEVPAAAIETQPQYVTDLLLQVRVDDPRTLLCSRAGQKVALLHHTGTPKPWRRQAWMRVRRNAYVRLLPRLLTEPDVALRLRADDLPVWLRPGLRGGLTLGVLSACNGAVRAVVRRAPAKVYRRLRRLRDRLVGDV